METTETKDERKETRRRSGKEGSRRSKWRWSMKEMEIKNRGGIRRGGEGREGKEQKKGRRSKRRCSRKKRRMMKTIKRSKRRLNMKENRGKKRKNRKRWRTEIRKGLRKQGENEEQEEIEYEGREKKQ